MVSVIIIYIIRPGCTQNIKCGFPWFSRTTHVMSIFRVYWGPFNRVDIEQVRFSYTFNKSITLCMQG